MDGEQAFTIAVSCFVGALLSGLIFHTIGVNTGIERQQNKALAAKVGVVYSEAGKYRKFKFVKCSRTHVKETGADE